MPMLTQALMTADELWLLPQNGDRHELVRGELRTLPPSGGEHGYISLKVSVPAALFIDQQELGVYLCAETGFLISRAPDTVRAPDFAFVRKERIPTTGIPQKFWPFAPDLAAEVVSPSDTLIEVEEKVDEWLAAGTRLVWVINPRRKTVTVYRPPRQVTILTVADQLSGEDVLPGFVYPVASLFR